MARAQAVALPLELRNLLTSLSTAEVADDQQWILALMRRHGGPVVSLLWRMLGSESDVLDAYQTAVCRLTARGRLGIGGNPGAYFFRTAMNAGIEILRKRQTARNKLSGIVDFQVRRDAERAEADRSDHIVDQRELIDVMRQAILRLPPYLRDVIMLRDFAELEYSKVARMLGISAGTARVYRRQAVIRLADLMGQEADE
jgi:RNA polymerase sigma-70 factor (ECF subfamily)